MHIYEGSGHGVTMRHRHLSKAADIVFPIEA